MERELHTHTCQCGHKWEHGEESVNNRELHTCHKCGTVVWERTSPMRVRLIDVGPEMVNKEIVVNSKSDLVREIAKLLAAKKVEIDFDPFDMSSGEITVGGMYNAGRVRLLGPPEEATAPASTPGRTSLQTSPALQSLRELFSSRRGQRSHSTPQSEGCARPRQ